ncbi:MAG: hypothetical protein K2X87_29720, partial [Gemmataceae bacterium]|nr:hypothetical protein [Gemmataceae bacterium]
MIPARPSARRAGVAALLALFIAGPAAAQVKYPPRPETVEVQFRYRIRADRTERVREFRELTAYLDKIGFVRTRLPDDETDILDPTAERMAGTIPSRNVLDLLKDPRVRTVLFQPTGFKLPDDQAQPVSLRIGLPTGYLPVDQQRLHGQVVAQLGRLGFREAVGYDTAGYSLVRGDLPAGNVSRLLKDLRQEPAGWFAPDAPAAILPAPLRDTIPVRWVELLPDPPLTPFSPQAVADNRAKFTPGLRAVLDDPAAAGKPVRAEVVYDHRPDVTELDALRTRLRAVYTGPGGVSATLEGAAGQVLTIDFLKPADAEAFAGEPGVVYLRRPTRATETVGPVTPGPDAPTADKLLAAARLGAFHAKGYRGQKTRIVVVATDFPGLRSWLGFRFVGPDLRPVAVIDLTAEYSREFLPAPAG